MKNAKVKKEGPGFKAYLGTTLMGLTDGLTNTLMTSFFMLYLTDYAGLGAKGAILGSTILVAARIFDAVNDPLEGWIMDRAKVGVHGKYKKFIFISILFAAVGVSGSFFIPSQLPTAVVVIWVVVFYLLYDVGAAFFAPNLIYRTLTLDAGQRGTLALAPRMVGMMIGMVTAGLISIINKVNGSIGNMHTAFGVTVIVMVSIVTIFSLIGISLVKEKYHTTEEAEKAEAPNFKDFFLLLKDNKALRIHVLDSVFGGFIWTFLFATTNYYMKWGLCADATGKINNDLYGFYTMISAVLMFLPLLLGTLAAAPILRKIGDPMKFNRILLMMQFIPCGLLFVLHITGVISAVPILFFVCIGITATAIGAGFMPGATIEMECMDYQIWKNGTDRSGLCNACFRFLGKAQGAIANAIIGLLLVSIGYIVDSTTGDFVGDIAQIPHMLNGFIVIMGLIPCVLGFLSWIIAGFYPINNDIREQMKEKLSETK